MVKYFQSVAPATLCHKEPARVSKRIRDLYVVWNEKINFLKTAAENNFFNSSYFLWLDIGAVRHKVVASTLN